MKEKNKIDSNSSIDDLFLVESIEKYYFYQSNDGNNLFLHPISAKWLLKEYIEYEYLPRDIEGILIDVEDEILQDELTRKRYKYLSHLPLGCIFRFYLIDISKYLSGDNLIDFTHELSERKQNQNF